MTYCLGMKLESGLVAISDTLITSGSVTTTAEKYKIYQKGKQNIFIMTSGLRSVRDKALTYFSELLDEKLDEYDKLYQVVNALGDQIKRVWREDKDMLAVSGFEFNINAIVGGQLSGDKEHRLYLLYPQGNWIEIEQSSPFTIIGNSGYGTPILRRTINYESSMRFALKTGFLSFDSTRVSANDVGFPIDVIVYEKDSFNIKCKRFYGEDLRPISNLWGEKLTQAVREVPNDWLDGFWEDKS